MMCNASWIFPQKNFWLHTCHYPAGVIRVIFLSLIDLPIREPPSYIEFPTSHDLAISTGDAAIGVYNII